MDKVIKIGIGTSKRVFQLHGVNAAEEPMLRNRLNRHDMVKFLGSLPPTVIAIESLRFDVTLS